VGGKTYLYGDSTDSGLTINYIELLRDFLDFAAQLMLSEHRISIARKAVEARKLTMEEEVARLQHLGEMVLGTLEKAKKPNSKSTTDQCIASLSQSTQETLRNAVAGLKHELLAAEQQLGTGRKRERAANARIIEHLLLNHELPDSTNDVDIALSSDGASYSAEIKGKNQQGLHWRFIATIPPDNQFSGVKKVGDLIPEMTISLPEMSGFVRKSVKLKPYRVFPLYICSLEHQGRNILLKLRSTTALADDTGLDILWSSKNKSISVVRMQKGDTSPSYDVEGTDVQQLTDLVRNLSESSFPLVQTRSKLTEILFNERPLAECEAPTDLIARLISRIGPIIRGIVEHSLGDKELVLKQILANDRREEIFASKADLLDKLAVVPAEMRGIFAPLGIGDLDPAPDESIDDSIDIITVDVVDTIDAQAAIAAVDELTSNLEPEPEDESAPIFDRAKTNVRPETDGVSIEIEVMDIEDQVIEASSALPLTKVSKGASDLPPMKAVKMPAPLPSIKIPDARPKASPKPSPKPSPKAVAPILKGLQSIPRRDSPPTMPPRAVSADGSGVITSATMPLASTVVASASATVSVDDTLTALDEEQALSPLPRLQTNTPETDDSIDIALAGLELE